MCPKLLHHPWETRTFGLGANRDLEDEFLSLEQGTYVDAQNMRPYSMDGDAGAIKKINGEIKKFSNVDNKCANPLTTPLAGDWKCILTQEVNDNIIEYWADRAGVEDSLIRINGLIVLQSPDFPIVFDKPLQGSKNESCIGGEVYITDFQNPPMIFNVEDLLKNSGQLGGTCSDKYFDGFDIRQFTVNLEQPPDHPTFVEMVSTGSTGSSLVGKLTQLSGSGLKVGRYQYAVRFVTTAGDRTQFSVLTPLIDVPQNISSASAEYPFSRTFGDSPAVNSGLGIKIRFRVVNLRDFDFIEIKRAKFDAGAAIGVLPDIELVSTINIDKQEIQIHDIIDFGAVGTPITDEEDTEVMSAIERAKGIRYFNNRLFLMNIEFGKRDLETEAQNAIIDVVGVKQFPTVQNMGITGHNRTFNSTYYESFMHGEKHGTALLFYDSRGERTFAIPIESNFQIPNRRVKASQSTIDSSYRGIVNAADTDGGVSGTHEVFDLSNTVTKNPNVPSPSLANCTDAKNILEDQFATINDGPNSISDFDYAVIIKGKGCEYQPFHPTIQSDTDVTGHNFRPNIGAAKDDVNIAAYNPKGFAPNYFSTGLAIHGIDITKLPNWIQAFSLVRSDPAGRVIAQGLGMYSMTAGNPATKSTSKLLFFSPDIDQGFVSLSVINEMKNNPGNFKVQLVSPLGFFTELYDAERSELGASPFTNDRGVDLISYARVLKEDGTINTGDNSSQIGNAGNVAFGKWRNSVVPSVFSGLSNGENEFALSAFADGSVQERGNFFEITLGTNQYATTAPALTFSAAPTKNWHEPFYIVNIIRDVDVPDQNINSFIETGHYQKINAIIGKSDGSTKQEFFLVDERWEDCIPALDSTLTNAGDDVFVFVDTGGIVQAWINVTFKSAGQITTITDDIKNNGFFVASDGTNVFGIYTHENINSEDEIFKLIFDATGFTNVQDIAIRTPDLDDLIRVKYSTRLPIRFFGGGIKLGESVFAPIDKKSDSNATNVNQFSLRAPWPYRGYQMHPYLFTLKRGNGIDRLQGEKALIPFVNKDVLFTDNIRQMLMMFTSESKAHMALTFNSSPATADSFPLVHYIMRPHRWNTGDPFKNLYSTFSSDYPGEDTRFELGGFRFFQQINIDYSHQANSFIPISKPKAGFKEKSFFCTAVIWSEKRATNIVDAPGVRTFPSLNQFIVDDDTGEIKYAFSALANNGSNLYAFTEDGIVLLLTDQRIITELSGQQLATVGTEDSGVLKQIWISKEIGVHDELWRSIAEWNNTAWFANKNSVYKFTGNELEDIGRIKYHSRIFPEILDKVAAGFTDDVTGVYDTLHNEYWLTVEDTLIVFNEITKHWIGSFQYFFDRFISFKNDTFGMRDLETFELNSGKLLSGKPIKGFVIQAAPTESRRGKEFIRIRVESNNKPNQIVFTDNVEDMLGQVTDTLLDTDTDPDSLLDYDGFEGYIPRARPGRRFQDRTQGRALFYKIIHQKEEDFKIVSSQIQYKELV